METLSATAFADKIIMARQRARAEHDRIFGKNPKTFRELGTLSENLSSNRFLGRGDATVTMKKQTVKAKKVRRRKTKKEICPHCATKNFVRVDSVTEKCNRCGYER